MLSVVCCVLLERRRRNKIMMKPLTKTDFTRNVTEGSTSTNDSSLEDDEHPLLLMVNTDNNHDDHIGSAGSIGPYPPPPPPPPGVGNTMESFNFENGEAMLVQELNNLSVEERERLLHEIHGVEDDIETPELVRTSLQALHTCIESLKQSSTVRCDAYMLAESKSFESVHDEKFRLMFLRAVRFDVEATARRLFAHFEKKLELFGPAKLCKKICLEDMSEDDMRTLENGQTQLLPDRDRTGRAIFFQAHSHMVFEEHENVLRTLYYVQMTALEDEETQKKGFVVVVYNVDPQSPQAMDAALFLKIYDLLPTLPACYKGIHYCVKHSHVRKFLSSIRSRLPTQDDRQRTRVHSGSNQECQYCLMTFGVPIRHFPISNFGDLDRERHSEFIAMVRKQEEAEKEWKGDFSLSLQKHHQRIIVPAHADVLLGRGRPFQLHLGNMRLSQSVTSLLPVYESHTKHEKTAMTKKIVEEIKRGGGRFLKQNDGVWEEVSDQVALNKISHTFRTHRSMNNSKAQAKDKTNAPIRSKPKTKGMTQHSAKRAKAKAG